MPAITATPATTPMQHSELGGAPIHGTSFSAPAVLSAAIQAQQYEGWFSALAYPMVNKSVLLASTRDSNADGAIGKASSWSAQGGQDAEDGAGQIDFSLIKQILDNNRYYFADLANSNFSSCGVKCRSVVVASVTVPAATAIRVALSWQACMTSEGDLPALNNDLDLALNCGSDLIQCGGTTLSTTTTSEMEMFERPGCTFSRPCTIEVRIKNGGTLNPCGSTTTERVGVAWSLR